VTLTKFVPDLSNLRIGIGAEFKNDARDLDESARERYGDSDYASTEPRFVNPAAFSDKDQRRGRVVKLKSSALTMSSPESRITVTDRSGSDGRS
jgi:hypothetical protein